MQANVAVGERVGRFDEIVGTGFAVLCAEDPEGTLSPAQRAFLKSISAHVVHVVSAPQNRPSTGVVEVVDIESAYLPHFSRAGYEAVVIRPDFYVFGIAATLANLPEVVEDLRDQLYSLPGRRDRPFAESRQVARADHDRAPSDALP